MQICLQDVFTKSISNSNNQYCLNPNSINRKWYRAMDECRAYGGHRRSVTKNFGGGSKYERSFYKILQNFVKTICKIFYKFFIKNFNYYIKITRMYVKNLEN